VRGQRGQRAKTPIAAVALCWLACLYGCLSDDGDGGIALDEGCDIRRATCQRAVLDATAHARDQPDAEAPAIRTIDVSQLENELRQLVDEEDAEFLAAEQSWSMALQLLGLLAPEAELLEATIAELVDNVQAYYDPVPRQVTVIDRGPELDPLDGVFVLAHELTHALQDQESDLVALGDAFVDSTDSRIAIDCLIEGEAMLVAAQVLDDASGPTRQLDWAALRENVRKGVLQAIAEADEPFPAASGQLPYALGTAALLDAYRSPGGAQRVRAIYGAPPTTVTDWADGAIDAGPRRQRLLGCFPTRGPAGQGALDHDTLGLTGLLALTLSMGEPIEEAFDLARTWQDDSLLLFADAYGEPLEGVAWSIRLDAEAGAALAEALSAFLPDAVVRWDGQELLLLVSADLELLQSWSASFQCGSADELPEDAMASEGAAALRR